MMISRDVSFFCQLSTQRSTIHICGEDSYRTHVLSAFSTQSRACVAGCGDRSLWRPLFLEAEFGHLFARVVVKPAGQINRRRCGRKGTLCLKNLFGTTVYSDIIALSKYPVADIGAINGVHFTKGSVILIFGWLVWEILQSNDFAGFCPRECTFSLRNRECQKSVSPRLTFYLMIY